MSKPIDSLVKLCRDNYSENHLFAQHSDLEPEDIDSPSMDWLSLIRASALSGTSMPGVFRTASTASFKCQR